MKRKDKIDLKNKDSKDLKKQLIQSRKDLMKMTIELKMGGAKNVHEKTNMKKDIARILTFINLKNIIASQEKPKTKEKEIANGTN